MHQIDLSCLCFVKLPSIVHHIKGPFSIHNALSQHYLWANLASYIALDLIVKTACSTVFFFFFLKSLAHVQQRYDPEGCQFCVTLFYRQKPHPGPNLTCYSCFLNQKLLKCFYHNYQQNKYKRKCIYQKVSQKFQDQEK